MALLLLKIQSLLKFAKITRTVMRGECVLVFELMTLLLLFFDERRGKRMARSSRLESGFQDRLKKDIEKRFPGSLIIKMNAFQGIPDLLVLWRDKWATLECKKSADSIHQPNQDYYVDRMNHMSFSAFIYPDNKEAILSDMERSFKV